VRTFTVDPHDERVIYAGAGPIKLLRSEDNGVSWEPPGWPVTVTRDRSRPVDRASFLPRQSFPARSAYLRSSR
jgi:hypothetical protein